MTRTYYERRAARYRRHHAYRVAAWTAYAAGLAAVLFAAVSANDWLIGRLLLAPLHWIGAAS